MKSWKILAALCCLFCLFAVPAMADDAADTLVIAKFKNVNEVIEQVSRSDLPIVDITGTSTSAANIRLLMETFPEKTFLYRIRAFSRHIAWDTEHLDIGQAKYTKLESLLEVMELLPNINELTTYGYVFTAEELDELKAAYPQIGQFNCKFRMAHHIIRTDLTAFCTLHASYTEKRHTQEDFAAFRHCPNLIALDVGHNAITDLSFLEQLPQLRILILADNDFTDISPIACQKELVYLELINNRITDVSPLANCPNLIDLHIGWCDITDISPLYGLTQLDRLWLAKNPIPQDQVDHIRQLLPNCTVNDTATVRPTAEGWRQGHPRYLKIQKIFTTNKYIPFP